ncbi:hypothetical protein EAI_12364, partial [Harpegnathos saltator]
KKMREVLEGRGVRVARPIKKFELRISSLDDSVTGPELVRAVAAAGQCPKEMKAGEIRRPLSSGLGSVCVQYPTAAARRIVDGKRLMVSWVSARVEALGPKPLQCFWCLEMGHIRNRRTAPVNSGDRCYRCGAVRPWAAACTEE